MTDSFDYNIPSCFFIITYLWSYLFTEKGLLEHPLYAGRISLPAPRNHPCLLYPSEFETPLTNNRDQLLPEKGTNLIHQPDTIPFDWLAPDESTFVSLGSILVPSIYFYIKTDQTFVCKDKHQQGKNIINLFLYAIIETVDDDKIQLFITGEARCNEYRAATALLYGRSK